MNRTSGRTLLCISTLVFVLMGCGQAETAQPAPSPVPVAETLPPTAVPAESSPAPVTAPAPKPAVEASKPAPLSDEMKSTILSTRTASVDEQIAAITNSAFTETQKAQACLLLLAGADLDSQRALAHEAVRHLNDSTRVLIREPLFVGRLVPQVLSIFLSDILPRSNQVKLPVLLGLVLSPGNPMQAEAQSLLATLLGKDYGTNGAEWEQAVRNLMAKRPTAQ